MCHRLKGIDYIQYIHYVGNEGELLFFTDSGNITLSDRAALGLVDTHHSEKPPGSASQWKTNCYFRAPFPPHPTCYSWDLRLE